MEVPLFLTNISKNMIIVRLYLFIVPYVLLNARRDKKYSLEKGSRRYMNIIFFHLFLGFSDFLVAGGLTTVRLTKRRYQVVFLITGCLKFLILSY